MKKKFKMRSGIFIIFLLAFAGLKAQENEKTIIITNPKIKGLNLEIEMKTGEHFKHPTMVFWTEDLEGKYLQALYVTRSLATGTYQYGANNEGGWQREPGEARRPATLPYWLHKRNIKAPDGTYLPTPENPLPDAITGATPKEDFKLKTRAPKNPRKFRLLLEINQPLDWNKFWHNSKYPGDKDYKTSAQPAIVYAVAIDLDDGMNEYYLNPIGHSHYSGKNGKLFTDLRTLTTAKEIVGWVKVEIKKD